MPTVTILVREQTSQSPIVGATVFIDRDQTNEPFAITNRDGIVVLRDVTEGDHVFETTVFGRPTPTGPITVTSTAQSNEILIEIDLGFGISITNRLAEADGSFTPVSYGTDGDIVRLEFVSGAASPPITITSYDWSTSAGEVVEDNQLTAFWHTLGGAGEPTVSVTVTDDNSVSVTLSRTFRVLRNAITAITRDTIPVNLGRSQVPPTLDQVLWVTIRNRSRAIGFSGSGYEDFINRVLGNDNIALITQNSAALDRRRDELFDPIHGVGAYELLKTATQVFLLMECGTSIEESDRYTNEELFSTEQEGLRLGRAITLDEARNDLTQYLGEGRLPYINRILRTAFSGRDRNGTIFSGGIIGRRASSPPLLELIWSYWHEEGMLVQTMNAISQRFQNRRSKGDHDPLAHLEIAPLYPLNNLLWGYVQDEVHSLSVSRRNYEYNHHYGLNLQGRAVSDFRPADPRSRFLEGFHNLLNQTTRFYKQDDDTTFIADSFPLLNSLREVHMILAEGAHNQFGDLPWTARAEMLMQQWLLSRPELREFLQSRAMVPYLETWMPQVDTMKQVQGWTDVSVTHFNHLATYGEQILLSIRYGDWADRNASPLQAANWARYWRAEIQNYIHSYRAATGVDLAVESTENQQAELRVMQPSQLLQKRLTERQPTLLSKNGAAPTTSNFRKRRAERLGVNGRSNS